MAQAQENGALRGKRNGHARTALKSRATDVLDDFGELRKDLGRLADATNKAAREEVKSAGKRLELLGRDMRERATDKVGVMTESLSEAVRERPGAILGLTLGAGLLAGLLIARRR